MNFQDDFDFTTIFQEPDYGRMTLSQKIISGTPHQQSSRERSEGNSRDIIPI